MKKKIAIIAMGLIIVLTLAACQQTDVVAQYAVTSFEALGNRLGDQVALDEERNAWALASPGGERFLLAQSFEATPDVMLEFEAAPFKKAGLDVAKLPAEIYSYDPQGDRITVKGEIGNKKFDANASGALVDTFRQVVKNNRTAVGYHMELDHYGIELGNGNMFEWAKDLATNDKDMVFVLNPQPFIEAGVDPNAVEGWVFAKVPMMDANNKPVEMEKLLKPYELGN